MGEVVCRSVIVFLSARIHVVAASNEGSGLWAWNTMSTYCPITVRMSKRLSYQRHGLTGFLMWVKVSKWERKLFGMSFANMWWSVGSISNTWRMTQYELLLSVRCVTWRGARGLCMREYWMLMGFSTFENGIVSTVAMSLFASWRTAASGQILNPTFSHNVYATSLSQGRLMLHLIWKRITGLR